MAEIAVVCPVWNSAGWTEKFLQSMYRLYGRNDDVLIIIVNNASTDNTADLIATYRKKLGCDRLYVITNETNLGYAAAANQGARLANEIIGDEANIIIMNNDVKISGDFVFVLNTALTFVSSVLFGATLYTHDTGWNTFGEKTIRYLEGWVLAMTWKTYQKIGGFDEQFFPCDYEDVDFSYKAETLGVMLKPLVLPLEHVGNQTGKLLDDRRRITEENKTKFAKKWGLI